MIRACLVLAISLLGILPAVLIGGCGGGGGGGATPASLRAASINAGQGARRAVRLVDVVSGVTAGRSITGGRQSGDLPQDSVTGLYYQDDALLNGYRRRFFTDAAGANGAGAITATLRTLPTQFPLTARVSYQVTAGNVPGTGELDVTVNDAEANSGTVEGQVQDHGTGLNNRLNLAFTEQGKSITGTVSIRDDDAVVDFTNIVPGGTGFTATLRHQEVSGSITQLQDGSGNLRFDAASGPVLCSWTAAGGALYTPSGATASEVIPNIDTEP